MRKKNKIMTIILIFLFCVVILCSALLAIWRHNENKTIEDSEDIGNIVEMNEYVSANDLENQASVEESDEVKESNEAEESDESEEPNESEESGEVKESEEAESTAFVFDYWIDFAGADFTEEWGLPYVDDETFEVIKKAYEQVDFFGEFDLGNEEVYDEYKEKYKALLENDGLVFDEKAGTSVPFSQIDNIEHYIENWGLQKFKYYFFDIDGDDLPELSVHINGSIYALDYDTEKDVYSIWYPMGGGWYSLIGTKKVQWHGNGKYLVCYLLDESGNEECQTFFFYKEHSAESYLAAVMLPEYAEEEKNTELTETMKSQGIYTRSGSWWFFRITKEQYDELAKPYWEAYDMAEEKIKEVTYTYEELFGGVQTQSLSKLGNKLVKEMKLITEKASRYRYYVRKSWHLGMLSHLYGIDGADKQNYFVPVLYIEIPNDKEKETRINRMLIESYVTLLPDDTYEEWWEKQEIHITYRSEKYLCFRYISNAALPKECSDRNLYFTLDLENESIIEYPLVEGQTGKFEPDEFGNLYKELEEYQEKTVEEQGALRGNTKYQVCQVMTECEGISFPCVEKEGLADKKKQEQINLMLQEPLKVLIEDGVWEDKENQQRIFAGTKIYIAYQTEQWLSVVYSLQIPIDPDPRWRDGVKDLGITINMQDGKRVLLDDLFEKDKILDWFYAMGMYEEGNKQYGGEKYEGLGLLLQTEKEKVTEFKDNVQKNNIVKLDEKCWLLGMTDWDSFYLHKGKLAILRIDSFYDFEIPLPEIYEYLKVDPWY